LEAASAVLAVDLPCTCCHKSLPLFEIRDWAWHGTRSDEVSASETGPVSASLALDGLRCEDLP